MNKHLSNHLGELDCDPKIDSVTESFHAGASVNEGVSGQLEIDTTFENTQETHLRRVSSDHETSVEDSAPHDLERLEHYHRRY